EARATMRHQATASRGPFVSYGAAEAATRTQITDDRDTARVIRWNVPWKNYPYLVKAATAYILRFRGLWHVGSRQRGARYEDTGGPSQDDNPVSSVEERERATA